MWQRVRKKRRPSISAIAAHHSTSPAAPSYVRAKRWAALFCVALAPYFLGRLHGSHSSASRRTAAASPPGSDSSGHKPSVFGKSSNLRTPAGTGFGRFGFVRDGIGNSSIDLPWFEKLYRPPANPNGRPIAYVNTIPKQMMLLKNGRLLYCPNEKAGSSSMYYTLGISDDLGDGKTKLGKKKKKQENQQQRKKKFHHCDGDCKLSAWIFFRDGDGRKKYDVVNRAVSITHVRNPWDRIQSTYEAKIATNLIRPKHFQQLAGENVTMSFADFVLYAEQYPDEDHHWTSFSENCLTSPNANGRVFNYDHIIRMEDFDEEIRRVFLDPKLKGIERRHNETFNFTEHTVEARISYYRDAATPNITMEALVSTVGRIYKNDIKTFGYSFDKYN